MAWGMRNIHICLFGSSIMEGRIGVHDPEDRWYNVFQRLLSRAHPDTCFPIINSAVGGESTRPPAVNCQLVFPDSASKAMTVWVSTEATTSWSSATMGLVSLPPISAFQAVFNEAGTVVAACPLRPGFWR